MAAIHRRAAKMPFARVVFTDALLAALGTAEGRQRRILLYAFARLAYHRSGDGDLRDRMIEA